MRSAHGVLQMLSAGVYATLGIAALYQWLRRRDAAGAWLAAAFTVLAVVVLASRFLPGDAEGPELLWTRKLQLAATVMFPYLLYRFQAAIIPPRRPWLLYANTITAIVVVWALALPDVPARGEPRPQLFQWFAYSLLAQWVTLSGRVAYRLWWGAGGAAAVARRRMRTMGAGAIGLAIAIAIAASATPQRSVEPIDIAVQVLAIVSAILFGLGFAPPGAVRAVWRQEESGRLHEAELAVMGAESPEEVAGILLPRVVDLTGGESAVMIDAEGNLIGSHGPGNFLEDLADDSGGERANSHPVLSVAVGDGKLLVQSGPYLPFFGREEFEMVERLSVVAQLAILRAELFRRQTETTRQLVEAQEVARIGSWEWDVRSNEVTWSEQLYKIFGVDPETFEPSFDSFMSLVHPADVPLLREHVDEALASGGSFSYEHRVLSPTKGIVYAQARGRAIVDDEGRAVKLIGTAQDVTVQKLVEQKFSNFLEFAPDAVVMVDRSGSIVVANRQASVLFGYGRDELVGRPIEILLPERFHGVYRQHREGYFDTPRNRPMGEDLELYGRRRDGSEFPVDVAIGPLQTEEGILVAAAVRDATERKRQEAIREQFVANAAHELRTPLTSMLGFLELLTRREDAIPEERRTEVFAALERSGERMRTLVENLLDLSKHQQGRLQVDLLPVDVAPRVSRVLDLVPPPEGKSVEVYVPEGTVALCDPSRFDQILVNLVVNAYKYGGPNIAIEGETSDGRVCLAVADDGPGPDEELAPHLFEPFSRGRDSSRVGGSGLGLAIVRTLVEACGGEIGFERDARGRTIFRVNLERG